VICSKFDINRSRGFQSADLEKRPFPLKASIAYTTLLCTTVHACDGRPALMSLGFSGSLPGNFYIVCLYLYLLLAKKHDDDDGI
jgi:hypothetical protein